MAKFYGSSVKTGRVGGSVFQINRGVTIERQYQPIVLNPNTERQVAQRAKMKLASQMSAALAGELGGFKKEGLRSSRNLFVADLFNRGVMQFSNGSASADLSQVRLTNSRITMVAQYNISRSAGTLTIAGQLVPEFVGKVAGVRIVVVYAGRGLSGSQPELAVLTAADMAISTEGAIAGSISRIGSGIVRVYAYAYMPISEQAKIAYRNLIVDTQVNSVTLATLRSVYASGMQYSDTYTQLVEES